MAEVIHRKKMRFGSVYQGVHIGEGVYAAGDVIDKCVATYVHPKHLWHPVQKKCRRCGAYPKKS